MNCTNCNAELNESAKFCPECGVKIEKKRFCPECGTELSPSNKFCPNCGTPISTDAIVVKKTSSAQNPSIYNLPFKMVVEDLLYNEKREEIGLSGTIETGRIHIGDNILITDDKKNAFVCSVTGVVMFNKILEQGEAGDNCILLIDIDDYSPIEQCNIVLRSDEMSEEELNQYTIYTENNDDIEDNVADEDYENVVDCEENDLSEETNEALTNPKYAEAFSEDGFWNKVKEVAKKAGRKVIKEALLLWYVLQSPNVEWTQKSAIIGALGYFILPVDLIPDFTPVVGFSDDLAALFGVHQLVQASITPKIEKQADSKLHEWFE